VIGRIETAEDLGRAIRDLRPDARAVGIVITDLWCITQADILDLRYRDIGDEELREIAERVDSAVERGVLGEGGAS